MQQDSKDLLSVIFDRHFDGIYRYFYFKTLSKEEAEDLTSETFYQLTRKVRTNEQIEDYKKYLYGIARNLFLQFLRKKYKVKEISLDQIPEPAETAQPNDREFTNFVIGLINKLPDKQAMVLHLRLIDKRTVEETATVLGKNKNYVKKTQNRAISTFKKLLACTPFVTK